MEFTTAAAITLYTENYPDLSTFPAMEEDVEEIGDPWPMWVSLLPGVALLSLTLALVWFVASRPEARLVVFQK